MKLHLFLAAEYILLVCNSSLVVNVLDKVLVYELGN